MAFESRNDRRVKRHYRARKNIFGTPERPRLCVFRSNKNISCQIIDDVNGVTLAAASSLEKELKEAIAEAMEEAGKGKGYVVDCAVAQSELVRPMVNGGTHITEFLLN